MTSMYLCIYERQLHIDTNPIDRRESSQKLLYVHNLVNKIETTLDKKIHLCLFIKLVNVFGNTTFDSIKNTTKKIRIQPPTVRCFGWILKNRNCKHRERRNCYRRISY